MPFSPRYDLTGGDAGPEGTMMNEQTTQVADHAVDHLAALVNLPIDPAYRAGVVEAFAGLSRMAAMVMEFPLADDVQPPSVFRP